MNGQPHQNLSTSLLQMTNGISDHRQVFVSRSFENRLYLIPGKFGDNRHGRRRTGQQSRHRGIVLHLSMFVPRSSKGSNPGMSPRHFRRAVKKFSVLGIRPWKSTFNVVNSVVINPLRNTKLVLGRK